MTSTNKVYLSCNILAEFYLQIVKKGVNQNDYNRLNVAREEILKVISQASKENTDLEIVYYYEAQLLLLSGETKLTKEKLQSSLEINPKFILSQRLIENCEQQKPVFIDSIALKNQSFEKPINVTSTTSGANINSA